MDSEISSSPAAFLSHDDLDAILTESLRAHKDKVVGWMLGKPGCWGFLAGQAVTLVKQALGRPLTDAERRQVWQRLWWWLEQLKLRAAD